MKLLTFTFAYALVTISTLGPSWENTEPTVAATAPSADGTVTTGPVIVPEPDPLPEPERVVVPATERPPSTPSQCNTPLKFTWFADHTNGHIGWTENGVVLESWYVGWWHPLDPEWKFVEYSLEPDVHVTEIYLDGVPVGAPNPINIDGIYKIELCARGPLVDVYVLLREAAATFAAASSRRPAPITAPAQCHTTYDAPDAVERWRPLVNKHFTRCWQNWALRIINCESRGNPEAANPHSSARGLFQHLERYWPSRSTKAGWEGASIFDPEANIAVAAWLLSAGGTAHWACKARK